MVRDKAFLLWVLRMDGNEFCDKNLRYRSCVAQTATDFVKKD